MPNLTVASICLDCEEIYDNTIHTGDCPACGSEVTCPLCAWIPPLQWVTVPSVPVPGPASPMRPWLAVDNGTVESRKGA